MSHGPNASGRAGNLSISRDGRFVAFVSALPLLAIDTNTYLDIYLYHLPSKVLTLESVDSNGGVGNGDSDFPSLNDDGTFVGFSSSADNLVVGDTNGVRDAFLRDRTSGTTVRVSVGTDGSQGSKDSQWCFVSGDAERVSFSGDSAEIVPNDSNQQADVFLRHITRGTTERLSVSSRGEEGNDGSAGRGISADGRSTVFFAAASNLVDGDNNGVWDAIVRGPELTLDLSQSLVSAGDPLSLTTWHGEPGDPAALFLTAVDGVPAWNLLAFGVFDAEGLFGIQQTVPTGLAGLSFTLQAFAQAPISGRVEVTRPVIVTVQ